MRTAPRLYIAAVTLFLGSLSATLLAKPPEDPAIHVTPTPAAGTPGSTAAPAGPVVSTNEWTYRAVYKKSARAFKILCYDKDSRLAATLEISNLGSQDAPGRLPKTAHPSVNFGRANFREGNFSFKGPAPRSGATYRFETTSPTTTKSQVWNISGDAKLDILP